MSTTKRCGRCEQVKPETEFNRLREGRQHWCRQCFREYFRARGDLHRQQSLLAKAQRVGRDRAWVREYLLNHRCLDCGETDLRVLDFDHIGEKTLDICEMVARGAPVRALATEIRLCEVVCSNCHRRRTAVRGAWRRLDPAHATYKDWKQRRNCTYVYDYLARHACVDCGVADPVVLEFDHIGPKRDAVTALAWNGYSLASIKAEIAQCEVRCCNCHRRRTIDRRTAASAG